MSGGVISLDVVHIENKIYLHSLSNTANQGFGLNLLWFTMTTRLPDHHKRAGMAYTVWASVAAGACVVVPNGALMMQLPRAPKVFETFLRRECLPALKEAASCWIESVLSLWVFSHCHRVENWDSVFTWIDWFWYPDTYGSESKTYGVTVRFSTELESTNRRYNSAPAPAPETPWDAQHSTRK